MDYSYTTTQAFETPQMHVNDFEFHHDFINETNFEQFIDLIREENADPIDIYASNYYEDHVAELMFNDTEYNQQSFFSTPGDVFGGITYSASNSSSPNLIGSPNFAPSLSVDIEGLVEENDGSCSSETTTTRPTSKRPAEVVDNARIFTSEKRRRIRMKEKLYSLRALVPNITKMDKASIIGDAVSYVQDLQKQAKKLKTEIEELESSTDTGSGRFQNMMENPKKSQKCPICKKILQMDVFQVEESVFYVRLVSNKGEGVSVALYKAIETLTEFEVQSSNFATSSETLKFTFMINVKECGEDMNLSSLKLWMNRALVNQGFEYKLNNL